MASPKLINAARITGRCSSNVALGTVPNVLLSAPTNTAFKINTLNICNLTTTAATVEVAISYGENGTGANGRIAANISIPGAATLNVIDKTMGYYLDEFQSLLIRAGTNGVLSATVSYEEIIAS